MGDGGKFFLRSLLSNSKATQRLRGPVQLGFLSSRHAHSGRSYHGTMGGGAPQPCRYASKGCQGGLLWEEVLQPTADP